MKRKGPKGWTKRCKNCGAVVSKDAGMCPACKKNADGR